MKLTKPELEAVRAAVHAAEGSTSGEIVPFVALRSDRYAITLWRAGVISSLVAAAFVVALGHLWQGWSGSWLQSPEVLVMLSVLGGGLGALAAYSLPGVMRGLAGSRRMDAAVHRRAMQAFLEEEVFDTRDRTGILLFVSLFERRIEVLGDSGINAHVSPDEWGDVIAVVRDGIMSGRMVEGLVSGIESCGRLLADKGVAIKPDDSNELSDGLRMDTD